MTGTAPDYSLKLEVSVTQAAVIQGEKQTVTLTVTRGRSVNGPIVFTFAGLPDGMTATNTTLQSMASTLDVQLEADVLAPQTLGHVTVAGTTTADEGLKVSAFAKLDVLLRGPAGALDTTFADNGKLVVDPAGSDDPSAMLVLGPHDEIYTHVIGTGAACTGGSFCLERFTPDGAADMTFGTMGKAPVPSTSVGAVLADGRFIGAGPGSANPTVVYRLLANGSLDSTFGNMSDGVAGTFSLKSTRGSSFAPSGIALGADGSVAVTFAVVVSPQTPYVGIARLDSTGTPIQAFSDLGQPGVASWLANTSSIRVASVAVKKSKDVILGVEDGPSFMATWDATELDTTGAGFAGFGSDGTLHGSYGGSDDIPEYYGSVLFADESFLFAVDRRVIKITPAGQLDTGFGADAGSFDTTFHIFSLAGTPDGRFVILSSTMGGAGGTPTISRFDAKGALDTSFGGAGVATFNSTISQRARIGVQSDGRILALVSQVIYRFWQ